ncbi:hypothetical protein G6F37_004094 [Rhizopus arrhizus]|nr:hypothetical protein G6F38_005093 [Rhizopus arrhizus]KAG1160330.1 hypothetical protein G6F37_004094 [Rhizopus arrhizus]
MHYFKTIYFYILISLLSVKGNRIYADRIEDCPDLLPRSSPPTSAKDVRPDDIKAIGSMGDSILAGTSSLGLRGHGSISLNSFAEGRGIAFAGGGDPNAVTFPNFIKKFSPFSVGGAHSEHFVEFCRLGVCSESDFYANDVLNAAQSAATSSNLPVEIQHIAKTMKAIPELNYETDWKFITVQIGTIEVCVSCAPMFKKQVSPETYSTNVEEMLEYVRNNIPNTIVNLIGLFNVSNIYALTENKPYCHASLFGFTQANRFECPCAANSKYIPKLSGVAALYNEKLYSIYLKYRDIQPESFGVMFTPANINLTTFPLEYFSDVDCFHPSIKGHGMFAKLLWEPLFTPFEQKPRLYEYKGEPQVYCPSENDRFQL